MRDVYRGHIIMLNGHPKCAVIIEHDTGTELPTKITALPDETDGACLRRARQLLDLYLDALPSGSEAHAADAAPATLFRLRAG